MTEHQDSGERLDGGPRRALPLLFSNRPWVVALHYLALAVLLAALGWSALWGAFSMLPEPISPWWTLATALPASSLVLLKRRAPGVALAAAIVLFAVDQCTVGGLVPLMVMLELLYAHLIRLRPEQRRPVKWLIVGVTVVLVLGAFAASRDLRIAVLVGLQFGALLGFTYWYSNSIAQSRELVGLYRQRSETAERLAALDREAAVQGERDRMARELHDVVAGHISAIAIRSEAALGASVGVAPGGVDDSVERRALRAVRDSSLEAHGALRSMIQVLRTGDADLVLPPGRASLPELVEAAGASGVRATLDDTVSGTLPAPLDQAVGSVVREALANSVRHSAGARVAVRVRDEGNGVLVEVRSRGGAALAQPALVGSGMGLQLLAERVRALGGELEAGPQDDGAWSVRARMPREAAA